MKKKIALLLLLSMAMVNVFACSKPADEKEESEEPDTSYESETERTASESTQPTEYFEDVAKWSTVTFGNYEGEEIEWLVLDIEGDKMLLMSKYAIECRPYNTSADPITWEECSLRAWLNSSFIDSAFSEIERVRILDTNVVNNDDPVNGTEGGNDTVDKVFLLSSDEAIKYFDMAQTTGESYTPSENTEDVCCCQPTSHAQSQGAWVYYYDPNATAIAMPDPDATVETTAEVDHYRHDGNCNWWLRSPANYPHGACNINVDGSLGNRWVDDSGVCVRPVMWVSI